ncbi:MAG: hydantoinase B/oxoprolinase family protein [Alicyclobacillus herbarius]|uniref:hydantoinase B/oxoprolinase family protein n=1 Tax=Alicyclobacillus herbarius TaxID=122960 RepID=UPI000429E73F|nr:hydantoinase B/oxoprolinase family protein [Alicyclobacillus herbarius]MCL6633135.1 hydantoinase B/oxoprolinase family protein [Alicyclobacillus herbarius]
MKKSDVFTLEVVKDSLTAIGEEMFYALARTSMSPIIYEVLDFASGLTDAKGQLLTQGNGVTGFIGMLTSMVKETLNKFQDDLHPGDIIILNDPYGGGGSHLSDVGLVMPIFYEGELVAFSANKGHWTEVGGKDPGSWTTDSTEIYQEGLQFPTVKLFEKGRLNQALVDLIAANVRFPDLSLGDLWAQVAGLRTGEKRFHELCRKYGKDVVLQSIDYLLNYGEQLAREELKKLPKGVYTAEDFIDDDGLGNGPFRIVCQVTISNDEFIVDFTGSDRQAPGPINCSYSGLVSSVRALFLAVTNPGQDVNDGVFRPLRVIADKGSVICAERPAPVATNWESRNFAADVVWKALAPIVPDRLTAGHLESVCAVVLGGVKPDTEEHFLIVEPSVGGWGAGFGMDGQTGQFCIGDGETYNVPVEVAETRYGVRVTEYSCRADGAGAGEFRGGSGVVRSYEALTNGQFLTVSFGRHKFLPWGAAGGHAGSRNEVEIIRKDGTREGPFGKCARKVLNQGDVVRLITATGGGYGNPLHRDPSKVAEDVKNGWISLEQARDTYGVLVNPETYIVDGFTEERRKSS